MLIYKDNEIKSNFIWIYCRSHLEATISSQQTQNFDRKGTRCNAVLSSKRANYVTRMCCRGAAFIKHDLLIS
jgi:hypothetical protein